MNRHFIAGALACFGTSLFGQTTENAVRPLQGTPNSVQNTLQNAQQNIQDTVGRNTQPQTGATVSGDASTSSSLNAQNQVDGTQGLSGRVGVQGNTNLQNNNNLDPQSGKLNSNLNTQVQGQTTLDGQQRGSIGLTNQANQYGNNYQPNGNNYQPNGNAGFQSQSNSRQGQPMQTGQPSNQGRYLGQNQFNGSMQTGPLSQSGSFGPSNGMQQSGLSQNSGQVFMLRIDASGREFICVGGSPVYFDNVSSVSTQGNSAPQGQYQAGYGNYDSKNGQNTLESTRGRNPSQIQQQSSGTGQNNLGDRPNSRDLDPRKSTEATKVNEVASPELQRIGADNRSDSKELRNENDVQSEVDVKSDGTKPGKTSSDDTPPKP